jgi:hypothetical protein
MADGETILRWRSGKRKPKTPTLSEIINNRREACSPYIAGELRVALVQREMARHGFTEEQALAKILGFS